MKKFIPHALFAILGSAFAGEATAASCPAGALICPASSLCVGVEHATTDTDGAPMAMSGTEITIGSLAPVVIPITQNQYVYAIPKNTTLAAGTVIKGVTIAANSRRSAELTCTTISEIRGPQSVPSAPSLRVSAGQ